MLVLLVVIVALAATVAVLVFANPSSLDVPQSIIRQTDLDGSVTDKPLPSNLPGLVVGADLDVGADGVIDNAGDQFTHIIAADVSAESYFTSRPPKVVALDTLKVYRTADLDDASVTGKTVKAGAKVSPKSLVWTSAGYPCLKVASGYITAQRAAYKPAPIAKPKKAKAVIAIDAKTGAVLYERNAGKAYSPASVAKLMTALLVREKVARSGDNWDDPIRISSTKIQNMSHDFRYGCGGFRLDVGKTFSVAQLYKLMLVESHNAAAIQLGIWVAGSNDKFVKLMNQRAGELKLDASTFVSASGLENVWLAKFKLAATGTAKSACNMMSAADVAKLGRYLVINFPDVIDVTKVAKYKLRGKTIRASNELLPGGLYNQSTKVSRYNFDGLKSGTTDLAGRCLCATAEMPGRSRVIVVVLKDHNRYKDTIALVASLYDRFELGYNG